MQAPSLSPQRQMEQKVVIAPLWDGDQILGTITVIDDVTRRVLQEEMLQKQIDELEQVRAELDRSGRDLAVALAYERDLVQVFVRSLLQDCPNDARFDLACRYYPAYTQEHIGGDFYDFVRFGDGAMGVVIGDVCGKGMRAAVYTAMAKYTFRAFALEDAAPAAVMMRLNRCLYQQIVEAGMFMSFTYVFVDIAQGRLRWANAGHPAAVLVDPRGQTEYLTATGPVIGAFEDVSFREGSASFEPGSVLALYTDGVTEADRREEEGERVVEQVVRQNSGLGADGIADLLHEYAEVASRGQLRDDIAIVVVRYPEDRS
jgi:serine phosphatase RsbU (regulator of sigma subunit)